MTSRATYHAISIKGSTHAVVKAHCDATGQTVNGYLERLIDECVSSGYIPEARPAPVAPPSVQAGLRGVTKHSIDTNMTAAAEEAADPGVWYTHVEQAAAQAVSDLDRAEREVARKRREIGRPKHEPVATPHSAEPEGRGVIEF